MRHLIAFLPLQKHVLNIPSHFLLALQLNSLHHHQVAKFKGSKCVLKEMPMADDQIRKQIEREVAVRGMFRPPLHPAIAPLDAVFYDKTLHECTCIISWRK